MTSKFPLSSHFIVSDKINEELVDAEGKEIYESIYNKKIVLPFLEGVKKEPPKKLMGFGLSKAPEKKEKEVGIDLKKSTTEVKDIIYSAIYHQYQSKKKFNQGHLYLGFGSLDTEEDSSLPLLLVPVTLVSTDHSIPFGLKYTPDSVRIWPNLLPNLSADIRSTLQQLLLDSVSLDGIIQKIKAILPSDHSISDENSVRFCALEMSFSIPEDSLTGMTIPPVQKQVDKFEIKEHLEEYRPIHHFPSLSEVFLIKQLNDEGILHATSQGLDDHYLSALQLAVYQLRDEKPVLITSDSNAILKSVWSKLRWKEISFPYFTCQSISDLLSIIDGDEKTLPAEPKTIDQEECEVLLNRIHKYDNVLAKKVGQIDMTYAQVQQHLQSLEEVEPLETSLISFDHTLTESEITQLKQLLKQLLKLENQKVDHPFWKFKSVEEIESIDQKQVKELLEVIEENSEVIHAKVSTIASTMGLSKPNSIWELRDWLREVEHLSDVPDLSRVQLEQDWSQIPNEVQLLLKSLKNAKSLLEYVLNEFHSEILQEDLKNSLPYLNATIVSPKRFLDFNFKKHCKRLLVYNKNPNIKKFNQTYLIKLDKVKILQRELSYLGDNKEFAKDLFGNAWKGVDSDPEELRKHLQWLERFGRIVQKNFIINKEKLFRFLTHNTSNSITLDVSTIRGTIEKNDRVFHELDEALHLDKYNSLSKKFSLNWSNIKSSIEELKPAFDELEIILLLKKLKSSPRGTYLQPIIDWIVEHEIPLSDELLLRFEKTIYVKLIQQFEEEHEMDSNHTGSMFKDAHKLFVEFEHRIHNTGYYLKQFFHSAHEDELASNFEFLNTFRENAETKLTVPEIVSEAKEIIQFGYPIIFARYDQLEELPFEPSDFGGIFSISNTVSPSWINGFVGNDSLGNVVHFSSLHHTEGFDVPITIQVPDRIQLSSKHSIIPVTDAKKGKVTKHIYDEIELTRDTDRKVGILFLEPKEESYFWETVLPLCYEEDELTLPLLDHFGFELIDSEQLPQESGYRTLIFDLSWEDPKANPFKLQKIPKNHVVDLVNQMLRVHSERIHVLSKKGVHKDPLSVAESMLPVNGNKNSVEGLSTLFQENVPHLWSGHASHPNEGQLSTAKGPIFVLSPLDTTGQRPLLTHLFEAKNKWDDIYVLSGAKPVNEVYEEIMNRYKLKPKAST